MPIAAAGESRSDSCKIFSIMKDKEFNSSYLGIFQAMKRVLKLYIIRMRLNVAERVSLLFAGLTIAVTVFGLSVFAIIFATLSLSALMTSLFHPALGYLIVAGINVLIIALVILFRRQLFVNPITRFVTSILIENSNALANNE